MRHHLTLALCTVLHAFTHAFHAILIPLYLLMQADLRLPGVRSAALIVSIYNMVYFALSYPAGILADRMNRKALLGIGLIGNALAFVLMGATHDYWIILMLGMMAGVFGTLYHPTANALIPAHYPKSPGMVVGIMGMGSGVGFFVGSQFAGWRAETVHSSLWPMSNWQVPCAELGLAGVLFGILFLILGREVPHAAAARAHVPMGRGTRRWTLLVALVLGCRDFAGVATASLVSIYLQKAHGFDAKRTGWILGAMGLMSIIVTPLAVAITAGRRRLGGLSSIVICGGLTLFLVPLVPVAWVLLVLTVFQIFLLASFAAGEVALIELVTPAVRGRVVGTFLTLSGTMGAISPWVIGAWTDALGARAGSAEGYYVIFAALGVLMIASSVATRLMPRLRVLSAPAEVRASACP